MDSAQHLHPTGRKELYTFWVNEFAFRQNAGFRMDFLRVSPGLIGHVKRCEVDAEYGAREKSRDHTPVWIELG